MGSRTSTVEHAQPLAETRENVAVDRPMKVLVVDDEELMVKTLEFGLRRDGYSICAARNGKEALSQLYRHRPDLVLLDAMMPELGGFEACRKIRAVSAVPIIFVTALDQEQDVIDGLNAGANDYVTKPFRMGEVLARVRAQLRAHHMRGQPGSADRLVFDEGRLIVDLGQRQVVVRGNTVALVPTEFKLLEYFARNRGQVLSVDQILEHVWGLDYESNNVKVYVSTLRQKIEEDPQRPRYIITRRGFGYIFYGDGGL
jgi:DNA-binding response OmpR family regulator